MFTKEIKKIAREAYDACNDKMDEYLKKHPSERMYTSKSTWCKLLPRNRHSWYLAASFFMERESGNKVKSVKKVVRSKS